MKTLTRLIVITLSIVALAAWSAWAGELTIPNTFIAGTTAVASEVNDNFSAVETEVDDNAADITTNTGNIATNTSGISTNTGNIATNTSGISTNASNIATNTSGISTNAADIATNAADITANTTNITTLGNAMPAVKSVNVYINTAVTSTTGEDITSLTVTPPDDGYVILTACGPVGTNKTEAANNYVYIYLTTTSGGSSNNWVFFRNTSADASWAPFSITAPFTVTGGVPTTFYLTAKRDNSGKNYLYVGMYYVTLTAIYVPNSMP